MTTPRRFASERVTIEAELSLPELIARAVRWVGDRAQSEQSSQPTGSRRAASTMDDYGAVSAAGADSAATATGEGGAASATGGNCAASATGGVGAASATGNSGAAMSIGMDARAMGAEGNALFLVYRDPDHGNIMHAWAGIAGRDGVKPMTWYKLDGWKADRGGGVTARCARSHGRGSAHLDESSSCLGQF